MAVPRLTKIGKYEILDVLGRGGMGIVYKAVDPAIGRMVAIKMITGGFSDDPNLLKRFYREAQSTGTLQHPNIVTVYDLGDDGGVPYLVMEYLEGETLESVIRSRREILLAEKLSNIVLACDGLDYAHRRDVVHRDIKPANIILPKDGGLKIVDFGIARFGNERFTRTGQVMGSVYYMSPEQINGEESDAGTDIYSTGIVLFEFLTGQLPFRGKDTTSTLMKILRDPVPRLSTYLGAYPPELDDVMARALAKSRQDRYSSIEEFAFDLQRLQEGLRRDLVAGYLRSAEVCIERSEWTKAKENIRQIFKLDRQNTRANELGRVVQARIQKEQQREQIRQLRSRAEEALRQRQWDDAITYLEQAIEIQPVTEVIQWRDSIREKRSALSLALQKAENAHRAGNLDDAKRAIEDALAVDSGDTQAGALKAIVSKELADRAKRKQIEEYLAEANREISSQRFTTALEILKKAESLEPNAGDVQQLLAFAITSQQQQKRRQLIERATRDIEACLTRDDFATALSTADEALADFPNDPALLRLRSFAYEQREAQNARLYIDSQMALARQMLEAGRPADGLEIVQAALRKHPDDTNLAALLNIVADAVAHEKSRAEAERRKKQSHQEIDDTLALAAKIEKQDPARAIAILEESALKHPGSTQLNASLAAFRQRMAVSRVQLEGAVARQRQESIATEIKRVQTLLDSHRDVDALEAVSTALRTYPESRDLTDLRTKLEILIAEEKKHEELQAAQRAQEERERSAQKRAEIDEAVALARSLLNSEKGLEARAVLEDALRERGENPRLMALLAEATLAIRLKEQAEEHELTFGDDRAVPTSSSASATVLLGQANLTAPPARTYRSAEAEAPSAPEIRWSDPASPPSPPSLALQPTPQNTLIRRRSVSPAPSKKMVLVVGGSIAATLAVAAVTLLFRSKSIPVHFEAAPAGATISVAGKQCVSPCDLQLKPGSYEVQVSSAGYKPLTQSIAVQSGSANAIPFALHPEPSQAQPVTSLPMPTSQPNSEQAARPAARTVPAEVVRDDIRGKASSTPPTHSEAVRAAVERSNVPTPNSSHPVASPPSVISPTPAQQATASPATNSLPTQVAGPEPPHQTVETKTATPPTIRPSVPAQQTAPATVAAVVATPVTPKQTPAVPSLLVSDKALIGNALNQYKDAYESESLDELLKIWPSMSKDQKKALKAGFESAQAIRISLECGDPSIAGDAATVKCDQSVRYTRAGKVEPPQTVSVDIVLKKKQSAWIVGSVRAN